MKLTLKQLKQRCVDLYKKDIEQFQIPDIDYSNIINECGFNKMNREQCESWLSLHKKRLEMQSKKYKDFSFDEKDFIFD